MSQARYRLKVYRSEVNNRWWWTWIAPNGCGMARSAHGYSTEAAARRAFSQFLRNLRRDYELGSVHG